MIAIFIFSWGAFIFSGYIITPWIPAVSPEPIVSGYLGFFSGVISIGFIPLLLLLAMLFKVIAGYTMSSSLKRATLGIWIVTFFAFLSTLAFISKDYMRSYQFEDTVIASDISSEEPLTIYIDENPVVNNQPSIMLGNFQLNRDQMILHNRHFEINPSTDQQLLLHRQSSSSGSDRADAQKSLTNESILFDKAKNNIRLVKYSLFKGQNKYHRQVHNYDLQVPVGTMVQFVSKDGDAYLGQDLYMNDEMWEMTENGLKKA